MTESGLIPGWTIHRADTPGVIIHVPHAGTHVPHQVREHILLDDAALTAEIARMTDWHTGLVAGARPGGQAVLATTFVNQLSRLVIDPERFTDESEVMRTVGMGAVYTRTSHGQVLRALSDEDEGRLLDRYFHPYADAFAAHVDEMLRRCRRCTIIDVHSYPERPLPYELRPGAPRPHICVGTDEDHTPAWLLDAALLAFAGHETALNTPFSGTYVPLRHYRTDVRVTSIMIEIRRDIYLDDDNNPRAHPIALLNTCLRNLVAAIALHET